MCDENEFNNALKEFNHELMNDPDTRDLGIYFDRMYGNRVGLWAYCHRKSLGINCNMHLESMQKTIKYHYLNGCKVGRLDKSITTIRRYTRDKKVERIIKLTKGKTSTKIQEIKKDTIRVHYLTLQSIRIVLITGVLKVNIQQVIFIK